MDLLLTALLVGFLGSGHCIAMCGSLSMAVGFSVPKDKHFVIYSCVISLGRILGYAMIGVLVSFLTQSIIGITNGGIFYLSIFSALLMLGIGLHIAQLNSLVLKTEKLGAFILPLISPIKKKILPIDSLLKCLLYGFFWGLLPCGLVYTAISMAITAPSYIYGGLIMLCFGIGTLPTLIGMTALNSKLNSILKQKSVRLILGLIVVCMALYNLFIAVKQLDTFS